MIPIQTIIINFNLSFHTQKFFWSNNFFSEIQKYVIFRCCQDFFAFVIFLSNKVSEEQDCLPKILDRGTLTDIHHVSLRVRRKENNRKYKYTPFFSLLASLGI